MDRRAFLTALTASSTLLALEPGSALAVEPSERLQDGLANLTQAWSAARASGRPLIVLVGPGPDPALRWTASVLGAWLSLASPALRARLGQVDLVGADALAVSRFLRVDAGELLMVAFPADAGASRPGVLRLGDVEQPIYWALEEVTLLSERLEAFLAEYTRSPDTLDAERRATLIERAESLYIREAAHVPGTRWRVSTGCGGYVEGESRYTGVMCGMGHVPFYSRRYLSFATADRGGHW